MIRNNFTSASIEFWRKHQAEKEALSRKNLIQGCFLAVGLFAMPFVILFVLVLISGKAHATGLTDLKFGRAQIADSQWNVQACTQTSTCQIYSKNPGTAYKIPWTSGQIQWATGDYIGFIDNSNKDANNPWLAVQYASNGVAKTNMGTGHIINMGSDYFFFVGNDNNTGQLFSMTQGFANTSGVTWTGTRNPTTAQVNQYAAGGSTTPLSAGQTAAPPASNTAPTETGSSTSNNVSSSTSSSTTNVTNQYSNGIYNYNFTGSEVDTTVTTITTPVTTTYWSDGTTSTTTGASSSSQTTTTTYTITPAQSLTPADRNPYRGTLVNAININQTIGSSNNTIQATQKGTGNDIEMTVTGVSNRVSANQGFTVNSLGIPSESTQVSNNNFSALTVSGNSNNITSQQTGLMNSVILGVTGNYNTATTIQSGNNNQSYTTVNGNVNTATINQNGNNNLSAINSQGYGNNITVGQTGNGNGSLISATNSGGPVTVNLLQQAVTQGQTFVVQQTCTNGAGCSVSVQQNR